MQKLGQSAGVAGQDGHAGGESLQHHAAQALLAAGHAEEVQRRKEAGQVAPAAQQPEVLAHAQQPRLLVEACAFRALAGHHDVELGRLDTGDARRPQQDIVALAAVQGAGRAHQVGARRQPEGLALGFAKGRIVGSGQRHGIAELGARRRRQRRGIDGAGYEANARLADAALAQTGGHRLADGEIAADAPVAVLQPVARAAAAREGRAPCDHEPAPQSGRPAQAQARDGLGARAVGMPEGESCRGGGAAQAPGREQVQVAARGEGEGREALGAGGLGEGRVRRRGEDVRPAPLAQGAHEHQHLALAAAEQASGVQVQDRVGPVLHAPLRLIASSGRLARDPAANKRAASAGRAATPGPVTPA